jgi:L-methionine (R)-S-oxide reductase
VPIVINNTINQIRSIAMGGDDRVEKAKRLALLIRTMGQYRWVGIYDVGPARVSLLAWSGAGAPEHPSFPVSSGVSGVAIEEKRAVIVGDVRSDRRYLATFESTRSEIIVPILSPGGGAVIGTIDVESENLTLSPSATNK